MAKKVGPAIASIYIYIYIQSFSSFQATTLVWRFIFCCNADPLWAVLDRFTQGSFAGMQKIKDGQPLGIQRWTAVYNSAQERLRWKEVKQLGAWIVGGSAAPAPTYSRSIRKKGIIHCQSGLFGRMGKRHSSSWVNRCTKWNFNYRTAVQMPPNAEQERGNT